MKFLELRAQALMKGQFDKANEIENKMTEHKNKNFDALVCPKLFFCTFLHEETYAKAMDRTMLAWDEDISIS